MLPNILKIHLENIINLSIKFITHLEKKKKKKKTYKEILIPYKLKTITVILSSLLKTNFNIAKTNKSTKK